MTEPKPIHRLEETPGGLRVITKDIHDLYGNHPEGRPNVLTREYKDLFTTVAEREWCDETFMYRDTESVVEFGMPHPEDVRSAIVDQDLKRLHCLETVIPDHNRRHGVLTGLQERIATEDVRSNQPSPRTGIPTDVPGEWHPEDSHNDGKSREALYDMAGIRKDAYLCDWRPVAGFEYASFRNARLRVLDIYESNLEHYELPALDVAGYPEWTYCRECGAIGPESAFLSVDLERRDGVMRVCDRCADRKAEYDGFKTYTPANVAAARDERAQRLGGQRNLVGKSDKQ